MRKESVNTSKYKTCIFSSRDFLPSPYCDNNIRKKDNIVIKEYC